MIKIGRIVLLCLLVAGLLALFPPGLVSAQGEVETIELQPTYRKVEASSPGANFQFDVALVYRGSQAREFDLSVTGPEGWSLSIKPSSGEQLIGSITVKPYTPATQFPDHVNVIATPSANVTLQPGEYKITMTASSDNIKGSVDLTAAITGVYSLTLVPTEQLYNTTATAGKDNDFSFLIQNTGKNTIENIEFSSSNPAGWEITFAPENIASLAAGGSETIKVNIKPDPKAIAGDYYVTLAANAKQTTKNMGVRVTVETPSTWGWVGVGIILAVIGAVITVFKRFSRR